MESMNENEVWTLKFPSPDVQPVSCKWLLRKKRDGTHKARLVARGFQQRKEIDYKETFAPVNQFLYSTHNLSARPNKIFLHMCLGCKNCFPLWRPSRNNLHDTA